MRNKAMFLLMAACSLSACVNTTPHWDSQFGQSARTAIASQTINPAASANLDPVAGIDSGAAQGAQKRYERTFAQPEAQPASPLINTSGK